MQVDHRVEVGEGIDPTDEANWVGSCQKCNGKRGALYLAAKREKVRKARTGAVGMRGPAKDAAPPQASGDRKDGSFFDVEQLMTPTQSSCVSQTNQNEPAGAALIHQIGTEVGLIPPRLETPRMGSGTYGDQVAAVAKTYLGIELMPWQVHALSGQLEHDDAGDFIRRRSLVSVARQNGKTVALKALILWGLTEEPKRRGGPLLVISTAHKLDLAAEIFEALAPIVQKEFGAKIRWSYGRQEAIFPDGTRWLVQAATPANFHGFSPTFIVADEVWNISREVLLNGALPSQRVMHSPLLSCWSTAGTEASTAMLQMREEGLRAIDTGRATKLYMAEWSVPPGVDPLTSPELWPMANPALGYTLDPEVLADESSQVDKGAFLRAALNVWISAADSWLPPGAFGALQVAEIPHGGVLAVDSALDDSLYCGVRAAAMPDGVIGVTVAFVTDSLAGCWAAIEAGAVDCESVALTPSLFELAPTSLARKKVQVGYTELTTHTATVRSLIVEGRIAQTGEQMLSEHVNRAVGVKTLRGYALSSQRSSGPINLARCMVWAVSLVARPRSRAKPAIAFG